MAGRTGWDLVVYVLSAILDLVLSLLLIPKFGINGAAAAQAITIACSNWLRLVLVRRFVGIFPWDRTYARLAVPAGACALTMVAVAALVSSAAWYVQLVLVGGLGVAVYVPVLLVVGLTDGEKVAMRNGLCEGARPLVTRARGTKNLLLVGDVRGLGHQEQSGLAPQRRLALGKQLLHQRLELGDPPRQQVLAGDVAGIALGQRRPAHVELRGHPALDPTCVCPRDRDRHRERRGGRHHAQHPDRHGHRGRGRRSPNSTRARPCVRALSTTNSKARAHQTAASTTGKTSIGR